MKEPIFSRIAALRSQMMLHHIDAYLVVTEDFHASEYVGDHFKCREFLSGFDGSAGTLVVTASWAGLWTDGRYFLQAESQLADTGIELMKMGEPGVPTFVAWLSNNMAEGQTLGYDGRTIRKSLADALNDALLKKGIQSDGRNDLVGLIWEGRPDFPCEPIWLLDDSYTGCSRSEKLAFLRSCMQEAGAEVHLLASLDDIAWLYNLRGNDVLHNPVALSYTLVFENRAILYISPKSVSPDIAAILAADGIELRDYDAIYSDLAALDSNTILLDSNCVNTALLGSIPADAQIISKKNPSTMKKAVKTAVEIENLQLAHLKDGIAMTKLIYRLKKQQKEGTLCNGTVTELMAAAWLQELRREQGDYLGDSFDYIVGTGYHGAIIHYEPTAETEIPIMDNTFLLMDTGAQYYQGTTDITRTISIGNITEEMRRHYTAVLRGHLNLSAATFRYGCTGVNLDVLARAPIWDLGLNYNHGTGHGVGYLLNVHEGPQSIRLIGLDGGIGAKLEPGMITSNEPGLYFEGKYGIRIENLTVCNEVMESEYGRFLRLDALTLVPYDRASIAAECMSDFELNALNRYHAHVYEMIAPHLTSEEANWLKAETAPISK